MLEERIALVYDAEVAEKLEDRHIFDDDICAVISGALQAGEYIKETETGVMIAGRRLGNVTFWVHFAPEDERWRVFRAYSHRMEVITEDK